MADLDILRVLEENSTRFTADLSLLNAYYDGEVRLASIGVSIPPQMQQLATVINWPRTAAVDPIEERLDIEGFRIAGRPGLDDRLWDWWQANDLDNESSLGHTEALVTGRAFLVVGFNDDEPDTPLITVESQRAMTVAIDNRTRTVEAALRLHKHNQAGDPLAATLYLPDVTRYYVKDDGGWRSDPDNEDVEHLLGEVPVIPLVNRARLADREGRSEMVDVMGLTDAACRTLTNLGGAQELLAVPQRFILGATKEDFVDADGNQIPAWQAYIGHIMALGNEDAKVGQFNAADLRNFTEVINQYARLVGSVTGLPPHYLGLSSDNPASADAIRSSEARLVKRAERRARAFSGPWEQAMRLAIRLVDGQEDADRLETVWRDPSTPTKAASADAATKLFTAGLIPRQAAWDLLGFTAEQQRQYAAVMDDDLIERLMQSVGATNGTGAIPGSAGPGEPDPAATVVAGPGVPGR